MYANGPAGIADFDKLALKITDMPNVIAVTPQIEGQVMATKNRVSIGAVVRGVRWSDLAVRKPLWNSLSERDIDRFRDENGVLIGHEMALKLGLKVGDSVSLTTARGKTTAFGTVPTRRKFKIAGIFNVGMYEYELVYFYAIGFVSRFLGYDNRVSGLEIYVTVPEHIRSLRQQVRQTVGSDLRFLTG